MTEQIWYNDLSDFMNSNNYMKILPLQEMSTEQKLNAILRFALYLSVLLALLHANYKYLFIAIITALVSAVINQYSSGKKEMNEQFLKKNNAYIVDNKVCSRSTVDNPFMNPSIADITMNPNHPEACNLDNEEVKQMVEDNFNARLFRDVSDLYGNMSSQRQFYTMPVTTIPSNQTDFANWLYNRGTSCKEGNGEQCYRNIHFTEQNTFAR